MKLLLDRATGIVFFPVAIQGSIAVAGDGNQYELTDCEPATLTAFDRERILIGDEGSEILVQRCTEGLRLDGRLRVRLPDDVEIAARSLASAFDGVLVSDEAPKMHSQYADKPEGGSE